jgi:hypothetical protein
MGFRRISRKKRLSNHDAVTTRRILVPEGLSTIYHQRRIVTAPPMPGKYRPTYDVFCGLNILPRIFCNKKYIFFAINT